MGAAESAFITTQKCDLSPLLPAPLPLSINPPRIASVPLEPSIPVQTEHQATHTHTATCVFSAKDNSSSYVEVSQSICCMNSVDRISQNIAV